MAPRRIRLTQAVIFPRRQLGRPCGSRERRKLRDLVEEALKGNREIRAAERASRL